MAMDGLLIMVCAGAVMTAGPSPLTSAAAGDQRDSAVTTTLAVQTALQQGREQLLRSEYRAAVVTLEGQLPCINGNQVYLRLLQDAYRRYIQELRLAKQDVEAQKYLRRLLILDRGAILDGTVTGSALLPPAPPTAATAKPAAPAPAKPAPTVRLKSEEEDPFQVNNALVKLDSRARGLLTRAEQEFSDRNWREALLFYEQAHQADQTATDSCRERWAYCKLFQVVEQLNRSDLGSANWTDLEREVELAVKLAPKLEYGNYLLTEIQKRRTAGATREEGRGEPAVAIRHYARNMDGWCLAETANFRIFHTQSPEFAEKVAHVAERTRAMLQQKWFGGTGGPWEPKCDLFLHATSQDYGRATGQFNSPGHSSLKLENGRLVVRRIDLHCENPNLQSAVLPHEATHVVLAGEFGGQLVPRWADEGMAVLTEPREKVERHLSNLAKCRQEGQLFRLQELMQLEYYPSNPRSISAFYAQSVSLVEFLTRQRGPQTFTQYLHDGMRYGYEKALERHYGYRSFAELEQHWNQYAFERSGLASIAEQSR